MVPNVVWAPETDDATDLVEMCCSTVMTSGVVGDTAGSGWLADIRR